MSTTETFQMDTGGLIYRDSDGEHVATRDPNTGQITYTHPARKRNYGTAIEAQFGNAGPEPAASSPPPELSPEPVAHTPVTDDALREIYAAKPPRHPQLGYYTPEHMLHDWTVHRDLFDAKWHGPMQLHTLALARSIDGVGAAIAAEIITHLDQ